MKRIRANVKNVLFCSIFLGVVACGGGGSVSTMDEIPKIMAPVSQSVSTSSVKISEAKTGLNLYGATSAAFPAHSSNGMCQMTNLVKNLLDNAVQVDKVKCYVDRVMVNNGISNKNTIYDGNPHIFTLNFTGNKDFTTGKILLQISKDGKRISSFNMKNCFGEDGTAQTELLSYTIDPDNKVTIVSKQHQSTWDSYLTVTGELDGNSKYKSKTIVAKSTNRSGANSNSSEGTIAQYSNALVFDGFNTGLWDGHTYINRVYSKLQLINADKDILHNINIGDGSATFITTGDSWSGSATESWYGDTSMPLSPASSGMYYSSVQSKTPMEAETVTIPDFTGDEIWDCSGTSEQTLTVDQADLDVACSDESLYATSSEQNWIDCSQTYQ